MCVTLQNFLEKRFPAQPHKRVSWLADKIGVTYKTAWIYYNGRRIPPADQMIAIYRLSKGAVQPNDFYALPDLTAKNGCALPQLDMFAGDRFAPQRGAVL